MKICVVQTRPIKGDIQGNIVAHQRLVERAAAYGAETVIFPELSLTGYEPTLAQALATHQDDARLDRLQKTADCRQMTIGVGLPTVNEPLPSISMVIFQPNQPRQLYSKQFLHGDEEPFFTSGPRSAGLVGRSPQVALAICYELSVAAHAAQAVAKGADLYVASVAKSASGVSQASIRLADIARHYGLPVLMSNCVGPSDDFESVGQTAVWNNQGQLLAQLDDSSEGFIVFDTETQAVVATVVTKGEAG